MSEKQLHTARIVSSIAATAISLACGTNVCSLNPCYAVLTRAVCLFSMGTAIRGEAQALLNRTELDSMIPPATADHLLTWPGTVW